MNGQSFLDVIGDAGVVAIRIRNASKDINDSSVCIHVDALKQDR
jgi:hypothetical protein